MTVIREADPVFLIERLRKFSFNFAHLQSVGPDHPPTLVVFFSPFWSETLTLDLFYSLPYVLFPWNFLFSNLLAMTVKSMFNYGHSRHVWFICGTPNHCEGGMKVQITVRKPHFCPHMAHYCKTMNRRYPRLTPISSHGFTAIDAITPIIITSH